MRLDIRGTAPLLLLALGSAVLTTTASAERIRILQTDSGDDTVHLIDPATQTVVGKIEGIPIPHGVAAAPDGSRIYVTSEAKNALVVVDGVTLEIVDEIPLSARPNNISIGRDGRLIYVGIMDGDGGIDIVDSTTHGVARHIDTHSRVHNTYVTPDGKYFLAGSFGGERNLLIYDVATESLVRSLLPKRNESALEGVRPIAFETRADGSTRRLFVQVSEFHGFVVIDFDSGSELERIELPEIPEAQRAAGPFNGAPSHGIGVAPDGSTLWVCSRVNSRVYVYALPGLELIGEVAIGSHPDWLSFAPNGRFVYVANGGSDNVSVIDVAQRRELARLDVGRGPKRNIAAVLR